MSHNLAVITVVYKNYSILDDLLASFTRQTNNNYNLYIVDLTENPKKIEVPVFAQLIYGKNKGYAHGVNLGLKKAINENYRMFAVINSDTTVSDNFIDAVTKSISSNPKSIIGGKIYYFPGSEYHTSHYSKDQLGGVLWYAGGLIDWKNVTGVHRGVDKVDEKLFTKFEETEFVTGCLMCFDKSVIDEIGYLNENYFLYFEDADYCERAKRKGIKLFYDPAIVMWHKNSQSTGGSGSLLQQKYQKINRIKFGLKYAPVKTKLYLLFNHLLGR